MLEARRSFLFVFLLLLLALGPSAYAQKTSGTITGTVTDDSGALVADASVAVTSVQTGASRTSHTNSEGSFSFPELNPGVYNISVTKQGFKKVQEKNGQQVRELPMNGRNFVQLTTMMPGAAVAEGFDPKNKGLLSSVDISFSGAPANGNQWLVDGANNNDVGSQHTILIYPSIDAIEEFKILRNSYGPEFGGAGGAQVNIVTRGGGNDFHGTAYYFGRNDALNAKNALLSPTDHKQLLRRNDYGYNIGGPIKKDKIFFFWSEEWNKEKRARVRANQVPTALMRTGDFSELVAAGCPNQVPKDPRTGAPFTNNKFGPGDLSPAGAAFISQIALPNRPNPCGINWVQAVTIPVDWREESVRGDVKITKNTVLTLRFTQDAWKNALHSDEEGGLWGEQNYPSLSGNWDQPGKVAIAKLTTTIGSTATNDFSFSWSANRINVTGGGDTPALNATIQAVFPYVYPATGKLHGTATASPLNWGGGPSGLTGHFGPWNNAQDLFTNEETGADYGQLWGGSNETGAYYLNPANGNSSGWGATGTEYGDYLLKGTVFGYGENARDGVAQGRWSDLELYVGDSWKVRPRLTLEYGMRWSFTPPVYDAANRYSSFRPDLYQASLGTAECNGILLPSGSQNACPAGSGGPIGTNRSLVPSNYHLIAPRLGFAWDVFGSGKFAVRGGVGQFFSRDPVGILVKVEGGNTPFAIAGSGFRTLDGPLCTAADVAAGTGGCTVNTLRGWAAGGSPQSGLENNNHMSNNWQWNLTTETQLWKDAKLQVSYVALRGIHLQ